MFCMVVMKKNTSEEHYDNDHDDGVNNGVDEQAHS